MSGGPRPPVPGLIPLTALSRRPTRPRRRPESIDANLRSRGIEARATAPGRRRHRRRAAVGKQSRSSSPTLDRPPRVNPIFVWVRQEDTRIVDVKCEDYDKRNRILLTKTAHGWRAIPRTEMLSAPRASAKQTPSVVPPLDTQHSHHHRHHHKRRSRKSKNQQSTSVQFPDPESSSEPSWVTSENVNIESLLPSHTIHVKRTESLDDLSKSVNSVPGQDIMRTAPECSTPDKVCDVSPLENLLAVAELELKQHMQSGKWESEPQEQSRDIKHENKCMNPSIEEIDELLKSKADEMQIDITDDDNKSPDGSYNDDDEMSMNDILSRLEQSLQSPQGFGSDNSFDDEMSEQDTKSEKVFSNLCENTKCVPDHYVTLLETSKTNEVKVEEEFTDNQAMDYLMDIHKPEEISTDNIVLKHTLENTDSFSLKENCVSASALELKDVKETSHKSEDTQEITDELQVNIDTYVNKIDNTIGDNVDTSADRMTINIDVKKSHDEEIYQEDLTNNANEIDDDEVNLQPEKQYELVQSSTESENKIAEVASTSSLENQIISCEKKSEKEPEVGLDLTIKRNIELTVNIVNEVTKDEENTEGPTDLSIRKHKLSVRINPGSPASQDSETSQSPQPSGIPAIPPSPDIVSTSTSTVSKPRSVFLESLLANSMNKIPLNSNITITKPKEPLDLGKSRKSASPTVTCSEEIVKPNLEIEPPLKKFKPDEITLKDLLDKDVDRLEQNLKKIETKDARAASETPRLLSLLKASNETQDPITEYKQLLEEIDIPNPLMVPKEYFPNLLKHPRAAILKILGNPSNKNIPLDDILVVYKDKLMAAIETSHNNSSPNYNNNEVVKVSNRTAVKKSVEKNNHVNEKSASITSKRKSTESVGKSSVVSTDSKTSLANDIDVANEAALFWAGCPNPFETMANYSNHDFIQALYTASTLPYFPSQMGELNPGLQMMLGSKMVPPMGFPPPPPINFNNPFELSMWQEAMMQATMLKNKNPYENSILNQPNYRTNIENKKAQMNQAHSSKHNPKHHLNKQGKNISQSQEMQQQSFLQNAYNQTALGNEQSVWPNPYVGLGGFQQGSNNLALNMPQFNPFSHRNKQSPTNKQGQQLSPNFQHKPNKDANLMTQFNEQERRLHRHVMQEQQKMQQIQHQKVLKQQQQHLLHQQQQQQILRDHSNHKQQHISTTQGKKQVSASSLNYSKESIRDKALNLEGHKLGSSQGPIDLSGTQNIKTARHLGITGNGSSNYTVTSSSSSSKNLVDDIPEVGSTTGSIEDMQDPHAQLWHPLFGSHNKGYNPWNLSSLTALGE